jgi:hypothetical protein
MIGPAFGCVVATGLATAPVAAATTTSWQTLVADLLHASRSANPVADLLQAAARQHSKAYDITSAARTLAQTLHEVATDSGHVSESLGGGMAEAKTVHADLAAECAAYRTLNTAATSTPTPSAAVLSADASAVYTAYNVLNVATTEAMTRLGTAMADVGDLSDAVYEAGIDTNDLVASAREYKAYKYLNLVVQIIGEHNLAHILSEITVAATGLDKLVTATRTQVATDWTTGYGVRGVTGPTGGLAPVPASCPP